MRIGELAERLAINPKTIRFYEGMGLLPEPHRTPSGYRDYGEEDLDRLVFIKSAQRLGLSLHEIREVLAFRERGERPCAQVLGVLKQELADIDRRVGELLRLRAELVELTRRADQLPDDGGYCPVITQAAAPPRAMSATAHQTAPGVSVLPDRQNGRARRPPRRVPAGIEPRPGQPWT